MLNVAKNSEWVKAIFRLLMTRRELHGQFNFQPEYFNDTEFGKNLAKLYYPLRSLVFDKNIGWTYKALEIAYFEHLEPELKNVYQGENNDAEQKAALQQRFNQIQSLFDSIEYAFASLSEEFIEDKLRIMCRAGSITSRLMKYYSVIQTYAMEDRDDDEVLDDIEKSMGDIDAKYLAPGTTQKRHIGFFDESLRVEITDIAYPTMMQPLNYMLKGGFKSQTLTGFMTRTGGGKSTILLTIAADAIRQGQNVYMLNMEMNDYDVNNIMLSTLSGRPIDEIEKYLTNAQYMSRLQDYFDKTYKGHFFQTARTGLESAVTMKDLQNDIRSAERECAKKFDKSDFKFDLVIIDYLYLMQPVGRLLKNARSDEKYKSLVREAHDFALSEKYAVITVFQTNRGAEQKLRSSQMITADDLADSYSGLSDIDNMFMLASHYVDRETGEDGCLITDIKIRKMYDGPKKYFFMKYDSQHCVYDSANAKPVDIEDESEDDAKTKKSKQLKYEISTVDVLKANPSLVAVPCGVIQIVLREYKISRASRVKEEMEALGWTPKTIKNDYAHIESNQEKKEQQIAIWKKQVMDAIQKTRDMKATGIAINQDEIKIDNSLFE